MWSLACVWLCAGARTEGEGEASEKGGRKRNKVGREENGEGNYDNEDLEIMRPSKTGKK